MITLSIKYGSSTVAGLTFSTADRVDIIKGWINCGGIAQKVAYLSAKINGENQIAFGEFFESNSVEQDLELILQSDDATEIVYDDSDNGGTHMGVKLVIVEAIL